MRITRDIEQTTLKPWTLPEIVTLVLFCLWLLAILFYRVCLSVEGFSKRREDVDIT